MVSGLSSRVLARLRLRLGLGVSSPRMVSRRRLGRGPSPAGVDNVELFSEVVAAGVVGGSGLIRRLVDGCSMDSSSAWDPAD